MEQARHYSKGGAIRHMADGGLIGKIKEVVSTFTTDRKPQEVPLGSGGAAQAKSALTTRRQTLDEAEKKAVGMKRGGAIKGKGTATSDDIPIMASNGEYMVKAAAVRKLGVAFMNKLNSIADDPADQKTIKTLKKKGAVRKMASPIEKKTGVPHMESAGSVDEALRRVAPYVNHRAPSGPPVMQEQLRLPNNAPAPGSAVQTTGYKPNFTMGANTTTTAVDPVTDVRAKYNPANASPEAKAYQAERAANPAPKPAGATQAPQPAPQPAATAQAQAPRTAPKPPSGRSYGAGKVVGGAVRRLGPAAAGAGVVSSFNDYKINDPEVDSSAAGTFEAIKSGDFAGAGRSISKGALETAMDLGSAGAKAADFFVPGDAPVSTAYDKFLRNQFGDQLAPAPGVGAQPPAVPVSTPSNPAANPAAAPVPAAAPPVAAPVATNPEAPSGAVRRVGNSYSGQNVAGDITINGQAPRGGFVGGTGDGTFNYGGAGGGGNDQALYAARLAAIQRGDVESVKASYGGEFGPKINPVDALVNNGRPMTVRKAGAIAQLQQAQASQQGAAADRKLAQDKFDLEKDGAKLDNQSKAQLASLQTVALDPNTTPEQRKAALAIYRGLTGKAETQNRYTLIPRPDIVSDTGTAIKQGSILFDNQTGQEVPLQGQQGAKTAAPAEGTRLQKGGKYFIVKNGVPVPL